MPLFIISRIIINAHDAMKDYQEDKSDQFHSGRSLAYYEVLDTIKR